MNDILIINYIFWGNLWAEVVMQIVPASNKSLLKLDYFFTLTNKSLASMSRMSAIS